MMIKNKEKSCVILIFIATGCFSVFIFKMISFSKALGCSARRWQPLHRLANLIDKIEIRNLHILLKGMCYSHFGNGSISITQKRFLNDNNKVNPLSENFLNTIFRFAHASEHCKTYHISVSRNSLSSLEFSQITLLCQQLLKLDVLSWMVNTSIHYFKSWL